MSPQILKILEVTTEISLKVSKVIMKS